MTRLLAILVALTCAASAQTYRTVTADTNNVIRTNFTLGAAQVSGAFVISNITGLQSALDGKLANNGDAAALTNFPANLLRTNGDGSGLTNLPNANLTNATGVLGLANGGTGQTNAALAIEALLPAYTNNADKILALNSNATSLIWTTNAGGGGGLTNVDLASTNVTGILPLDKGGTGGTNTSSAQIALGIRASGTGGAAILGALANVSTNTNASGAAIGNNARTLGGGAAVGQDAKVLRSPGIGSWGAEGGAIGLFAEVNGRGGAIGASTYAINGFAGGPNAKANATNSAQILEGTNTNNFTIQFLSAGTIDTNEWSRLAALSTYPTTNISVVGTNNTNTLVFSNGILVQVQ